MNTEANQLKANRIKHDWQHFAGSELLVNVEYINGVYYGYSTELGCLRVLNHYSKMKSDRARAFFSENMGTWVIALDMNLNK